MKTAYGGLGVLCILVWVGCGGSSTLSEDNTDSGTNNNIPVNCGNGEVDEGEECDEGDENSDTSPDACRLNCTLPECGDGVADTDESCDGQDLRGVTCQMLAMPEGVLVCSSTCSFNTIGCNGGTTVCGNGVVEPGESCDDGNLVACDGCSPTCLEESCGNGVTECSEECDDGNSSNEDFCTTQCKFNVCGDGYINSSVEECDDGNGVLTDACPDGIQGTCLWATCGDGFVQTGVETCDDNNSSNEDACPSGVGGTCQPATCGDGFVQTGVEVCDPGSFSMCNPDCQGMCGDGVINQAYEVCDDMISCVDCQTFCGDGVVNGNEQCDEGGIGDPYNGDPIGYDSANWSGGHGLGCWQDCTPRYCGDGICEHTSYPTSNPEFICDCPQDCKTALWPCDPVAQCECPAGQYCYVRNDGTGTICLSSAGNNGWGESCTGHNQCEVGMGCHWNTCYPLFYGACSGGASLMIADPSGRQLCVDPFP